MARTAILYIAERCNQSCVFCLEEDGSWNEFVDPSTQQVFDTVGRVFERGARHITFMGGETFFRKDLPRILSHAKDVGFTRVGVTTNGTVLSKVGFIDRLCDAGLDFIELSIHGHTEALANEIARSKITHQRQASALAEINRTGALHTIVNLVVCAENKDHLREIVRYVHAALPHVRLRFKLKFVSLQGWAAEKAAKTGDALRYEDVDFVGVGDVLEELDVGYWYYNVPLCHLGRHARHSHEAGTLSCGETYFDLEHRGRDEYYDSGDQLEGRVWPEASCEFCTLEKLCPGLEESYRRVHGVGSVARRSDAPLDFVDFALRDRGEDPLQAQARLEALASQERPRTFVRERADGALRFLQSDGAPGAKGNPLDLMVLERDDSKQAYAKTERFELMYRGQLPEESRAAADVLLRAAVDVLELADAATADLAEATEAIAELKVPGWRLDSASRSPVRPAKTTRSLPMVSSGPPPGVVDGFAFE
jgi:organic radical activating enzyme